MGTEHGSEDRVRAAVIVGAGFSGLGAAIRLDRAGVRDFTVLEKAHGVGGTWRFNRYPGCACDVPSHLYSFSFDLNPDWSRHYAPQPEILAYLERCADRFGVRDRVRTGARFEGATWDEGAACWRIRSTAGPLSARFLVLGLGPLHVPRIPDLPGRFDGPAFHTSAWDPSVDLRGRRVAVVGTGASAIQVVPALQPVVDRLVLFQRTPAWIIPRRDRAIPRWRRALFRRSKLAMQAHRARIYWQQEAVALAMTRHPRLMRAASRLARRHLRAQVPDPALRARLTPDYVMGCKRILLSDDFYPAVQQPNVELIDEALAALEPGAVVSAGGVRREVDAIVWATGFRVTDAFPELPITGRDGLRLADAWAGGPEAYMGTFVAGFPNLATMLGPNTGLGHNSMVFMIEAQLDQVVRAVRLVASGGARSVEVRPEAQAAFNREIQDRLGRTVWMSGCRSWYVDPDGVNRTVWPDYTWRYWLRGLRADRAAWRIRS